MKRLLDYKSDEGIEKAGELMEHFFSILEDQELMKELAPEGDKMSPKIIGKIMAKHKKEALQMISIIDDEPITAANAFPRFFSVFTDVANDPYFVDFFTNAVTNAEL